MSRHDAPKAAIVVIDDTPANLRLLTGMLTQYGYKVRPMPNGEMGLKTVQAAPPDLILLDISMPRMDGYEVCERLKADPKTKEIPVIFISALGEALDKVRAFNVGGVDYITKPFQVEEVLVRIRTQLELKTNRDRLRDYNRKLEEAVSEKAEFLDLVGQELKNPLNAIKGYGEFLAEQENAGPNDIRDTSGKILRVSQNMYDLIIKILDINMLELGKHPLSIGIVDLSTVARAVVEKYHQHAKAKQQEISFLNRAHYHYALGDQKGIYRVLENLLSNAIKFAPYKTQIRVEVYESEQTICCEVADQGPGLTPEDHQRLFKKYMQLSAKPTAGESTSRLGLSISQALTQAMEGKLWCHSVFGQGATFYLQLPIADQQRQAELDKA